MDEPRQIPGAESGIPYPVFMVDPRVTVLMLLPRYPNHRTAVARGSVRLLQEEVRGVRHMYVPEALLCTARYSSLSVLEADARHRCIRLSALTALDLTTSQEKAQIHIKMEAVLARLNPMDRLLPQACNLWACRLISYDVFDQVMSLWRLHL